MYRLAGASHTPIAVIIPLFGALHAPIDFICHHLVIIMHQIVWIASHCCEIETINLDDALLLAGGLGNIGQIGLTCLLVMQLQIVAVRLCFICLSPLLHQQRTLSGSVLPGRRANYGTLALGCDIPLYMRVSVSGSLKAQPSRKALPTSQIQ